MKKRLKEILGSKIENFDKEFNAAYYDVHETYNNNFLEKMVELELIKKVRNITNNDINKMASELAHTHIPDNEQNFIDKDNAVIYSESAQKLFDEWYNYYWNAINDARV